MSNASLYELRKSHSRSSTEPLLPEMYPRPESDSKERPTHTCVECGIVIPSYSNYFCESHLIEFLTTEPTENSEFPNSKARFTISGS